MRTIENHWTPNAPRGDYAEMCDYCGAQWRRSTLRRTRDGLLACEDCDEGGVDVAGKEEEIASRRPRPSTPRRWD